MKKLVRVLFGYLLFDDRQGTPIEGLPAPLSFWCRAWWPDEDFPLWWARAISWVRHAWYRNAVEVRGCPGCDHLKPRWWADGMCRCCFEEDCCHEEE